jgi:hypothetical protein
MDVQNVSAQLFVKQLPPDQKATYYGCRSDFNAPGEDEMTTCVEPVSSDAQIENAFQEQLDLTEYYKSPAVFNTMKKDFMEKTMGGYVNIPNTNFPIKPPPSAIPPAKLNIPDDPRDFLQMELDKGKVPATTGAGNEAPQPGKSTFGASISDLPSWAWFFIILAVLIILAISYKK